MSSAPLAFVDVEATGLDHSVDRVVEICIERTCGGQVVDRIESLINPGPRAGGAEHVHGLSALMLSASPPFSDIAKQVAGLLEGAVFVAHASKWDVLYIESELARAGCAHSIPCHLDTLALARRAFGLRSNRLGALAVALGLAHDTPHRAAGDVAVLRALFGRVVEALNPDTPRDLWRLQDRGPVVRPEIVVQCVAAIGKNALRVRYRSSRRGPEDLLFVVCSVRTELDPPRMIGYLLPGRGHRELRLDRILAVESLEGSNDGSALGTT